MQTNRRGFHDIDIDFEGIMVEGGLVDELFRLQDLKNRKLFLKSIKKSRDIISAVW